MLWRDADRVKGALGDCDNTRAHAVPMLTADRQARNSIRVSLETKLLGKPFGVAQSELELHRRMTHANQRVVLPEVIVRVEVINPTERYLQAVVSWRGRRFPFRRRQRRTVRSAFHSQIYSNVLRAGC